MPGPFPPNNANPPNNSAFDELRRRQNNQINLPILPSYLGQTRLIEIKIDCIIEMY